MVVFLCGTYVDLASEREAVLRAVEDLKHERQAMELFGARPDRAIETCLAEVRASDVVIVVIGFLYGSPVPGSEISFTQTEYEEAYRLEKTCLVYVRNEDALIPAKYVERNPDKLRRLETFRNLVESRHTVVRFRQPEDLAAQVEADLTRLVEKSRRAEPPEAASGDDAGAMIRDLEIAAAIQRQLLPAEPLQVEGYDIAGLSARCHAIGGDYYDFFRYPEGYIAVVIADVSGKSFPAALLMTSIQARVRILADYGHPPAEFMTRLNRSLRASIPRDRYATLFFALLRPDDGQMIYCNAGHSPAMIAREGGSVERISAGGLPIGLIDGVAYEHYTTHLEHGDELLLYTDGVTESMSGNDEEFGEDRVAAILRENRNRPSHEICEAIVNAAREWAADQFLVDDVAVVAARRL